jgi:hypothetical protein
MFGYKYAVGFQRKFETFYKKKKWKVVSVKVINIGSRNNILLQE